MEKLVLIKETAHSQQENHAVSDESASCDGSNVHSAVIIDDEDFCQFCKVYICLCFITRDQKT